MANPNFDVTIKLVPKLTTQQAAGAGSTGNKKRRFSSCDSVDSSEGGGHGPALAIVKVRSSKLRECSAYFEACISERWAQPETTSKTKFCLEAQAEVRHYVYCFSRMQFLCKPITSVADCIELLKIASQIDFQGVVDIGVKYLAAAPWDDDEEQHVREFCTFPHLVPCDSLADLFVRLEDLPSGVEAKQEKLSLCAMNLLSCYLRVAISYGSFTLNPERYGKFAESFHLIVSGSESGAVCEKVVKHAMVLITQESARLLSHLQKESCDGRFASTGVRNAVSSFCWLFKVARHCNVAQAVVELLVNDVAALCVLYDGFRSNPTRQMGPLKKWARMVYRICEDVLDGKLFLQGRWLLFDRFLDVGETQVAAFVTRFITTLPLRQHSCGNRNVGTTLLSPMATPPRVPHAM